MKNLRILSDFPNFLVMNRVAHDKNTTAVQMMYTVFKKFLQSKAHKRTENSVCCREKPFLTGVQVRRRTWLEQAYAGDDAKS